MKRKQDKRPPKVKMSEETRRRLLDPSLLPDSIAVGGTILSVHKPVAAGGSGAVWKCTDQYGRYRAVKLAIPEHYEKRSPLEEITRAANLEKYPLLFAKIYDAEIVNVEFADEERDRFVVFVEEWVNGITLSELIRQHPDLHTVSVLKALAESFSCVLAALDAEGLMHDDLNPGNVMIVPPGAGDLDQSHSIKIIDLSSLKPTTKPSRKVRDDHRWIVEHLICVWNSILRRKELSIRDRRFLAELESVLGSMLDDDPLRRLTSPEQIRDQINGAYTRSQSSRKTDANLALVKPFDFISAEHIWDDRLLVRLFANSCPWLPKVVGPDPCLVTGPRGCGKSTIFRWLSLKAQLLAYPTWSQGQYDAYDITGFYISCSSDLQNRFASIKTPSLAERFENEIIHYFNLLAAREVLETLRLISARSDSQQFWGMGETQIRVIHQFVFDNLSFEDGWRLQGVSLLEQAIDAVERLMFKTHVELMRRKNMRHTTALTFLGDLTQMLVNELPVLRDRKIAFLIDDFSIHRIPKPVQIVLNRIVWERRDSHVFKMSSEKYGTSFEDSGNVIAELSRELVEIDCGQEYIALDDHERQAEARIFAQELLDNRLRAAGYRGRTESLIGESRWPEGSLGRALKEKGKKGRSNDQYHGIECIAQLCSGDIASLLLVYRNIFDRARITSNSTDLIAKTTQHEAIRKVSQRMFDRIRTYHPLGREMYEIVNQFGTLVRRILEDGKMQKHGRGNPEVPPQCPRIEINQREGAVTYKLPKSQYELARELIRRTIFIEMEPGLSRRSHVTTLRWQLRRIFLPNFNAALAKNDAVKQDPEWFNYFLANSKEACALAWKNRQKEPRGLEQGEFVGLIEQGEEKRND